jgi:succinoglycan biosynthesis protein ExoM
MENPSVRSSFPVGSADISHFAPTASSNEPNHVCVCICTYKRAQLLKHLLEELAQQETDGSYTYSILVVDNDQSQSARPVVLNFADQSTIPIQYCVEDRQNIALARNKAIDNAAGEFVAFIDDDEFPVKRWLVTLLNACKAYGADGVLGPVKPYYNELPPTWVVRGKFHERSTYPTGFVINWRQGRTGNVLLKKQIFVAGVQHFIPEFRTGEDQDFFRRMIEKKHTFIWCDEALAYEVVPPIRWKRTFMLRRALLRGAIEPKTANFGFRSIAKSIIAVPAYIAVLPFALVFSHHKFMTYLVSLFDHLGKLLAILGINPIRETYVTE